MIEALAAAVGEGDDRGSVVLFGLHRFGQGGLFRTVPQDRGGGLPPVAGRVDAQQEGCRALLAAGRLDAEVGVGEVERFQGPLAAPFSGDEGQVLEAAPERDLLRGHVRGAHGLSLGA